MCKRETTAALKDKESDPTIGFWTVNLQLRFAPNYERKARYSVMMVLINTVIVGI